MIKYSRRLTVVGVALGAAALLIPLVNLVVLLVLVVVLLDYYTSIVEMRFIGLQKLLQRVHSFIRA